ncbi:universal stress protein [Gilvimarinus polysaccharolyticus]|uniref:universal stress protein n=1 Tax=Gilvimarinus polysaccharolyticus TaxID=863921 RepID=UPI0006736AF1|nr:universal stress protein [Gilvimarinus polysaccharolyticus]
MRNKVIACIDDSQYAQAICDYAAWSAKQMGAPLSLLHVLANLPHPSNTNLSGTIGLGSQEALLEELAGLDERRSKIAMEQGKAMLQAARERVSNHGIAELESRQRHGELLDTLKDLEDETRMLVVGKRGADTASAHGHIGSHLEGIIRTMNCPVLIAQQSFTVPSQIMIAFDGSATGFKCIEMVAASPLFKGISCHLVMAGSDTPDNQAALAKAQATLKAAGFDSNTALVAGDAEKALADYQQQQNIDLLIMGAYGHSRIRHFIVGSTTTAMIRRTRISLLVLR